MKKERKLDVIYTEFNTKYANKTKEEMEKIISDLEKEIAGKNASLEGMDGESKANLQKDIESKKKRLENLKGYTKNKKQIEGIKEYKQALQTKLIEVTKTRDSSKKTVMDTRKELIEIGKKLADEKYTMSLNQNEYNELLQEKADKEKEVKIQSELYNKSQNRVEELTAKISKCDLAWKTLFVNKDWDEIQRIATSKNQRFTKKISEEKPPIGTKKKEEIKQKFDEEKKKISEEIGKKVSKILSEKKEDSQNAKTEALVEYKTGFFRKMWNNFRSLINKYKNEKKTNVPEKDDNKEEEKNDMPERDAFLEGLRQHVDVQYKQTIREEKELKYREAHKIPNKEKHDKEEQEL